MTDKNKERSLISLLKSLFPLLGVKDMHRVAVMLPNKETEAEMAPTLQENIRLI